MRSISLKTIVWAFSLIMGTAFVDSGRAQTESILVPLNYLWRYYTNAGGPAANWTNNGFSDTTWPQGRATFGTEDANVIALYPIQTPIPQPNPPGNGPNTVYFRAAFNFPSNTAAGVTFVFSNILDDGAVFYINGKEVQRVRVAAGAVTYATFAAQQNTEGQYETFTVVGTNSGVRQGANLFAAELHNVNATSSDTVFLSGLSAIWPTRLVITNQPDNALVSHGRPATFNVGVSGPDPIYQWYQQNPGVTLPSKVGPNSPTYTIGSPNLGQSGARVWVVCSNVLGAVTSSVAILTVVRDVYPPGLISAIASDNPTNKITVTFTEPLLPRTTYYFEVTNLVNYVIRRLGTTNTVRVTNVTYSGDTVTLSVSTTNWLWGSNYLLTVTNICDTKTNFMSPASNMCYITFPKEVLDYNAQTWVWNNIYPYFGIVTNISQTGDWRMPGYAESNMMGDGWLALWISKSGIMYYDNKTPLPSLCAPIDTGNGQLGMVGDINYDRTNFTTYYFRTHFELPPNNGKGSVRLSYACDNGVIFYLNGVEIYRANISSGKVVSFTTGDLELSPTCRTPTAPLDNIPVDNLRTGDNVLAAEVHMTDEDATESDIYYGNHLSLIFTRDPPIWPALTIKRRSDIATNRTVVITWPASNYPGFTLQETTSISPSNRTWSALGTNSPYTNSLPVRTNRFWRLRGPDQWPP